MDFSFDDLNSLYLTLKLAVITTIILLILGIPFSWWLCRTNSFLKPFLNAIVSLPLVLPPTVLGFYLLLALAPSGFVGSLFSYIGFESLPFSFTGLVIGSLVYSLPFVIQPLRNTFEQIPIGQIESAYTLGANPFKTFLYVILPQAKGGIVVASVLGFAHTVGEFGVVLMLGGNIPNKTKVLSVSIYEKVETLNYQSAHKLSLILLIFSFFILLVIQKFAQRKNSIGVI